MIASIIYNNNNTKCKDYDDKEEIEIWLHSLRAIGKKNRKAELFLTVQSIKSVPKLVAKELDYIKKQRISIRKKEIDLEYVYHIGMLLRVNLQYRSLKQHKNNLIDLCQL